MRLNFFTPLPELRTDIANMSAMVLVELGRIAQVRAWTVQAEWHGGLGDSYEIRHYDPDALPIRDFNWADVNFYNIGNDATYHRAIFDVARRIPGIHILHDIHLAHFFATFSIGSQEDRNYYQWEMDQIGLGPEARDFMSGDLEYESLVGRAPMTRAMLRPALGAIVHNFAEMDAVAMATTVPLFHVPLCFAQPVTAIEPQVERRFGDGQPIRLIVFGFIGRNRCLREVLQALAGMPDRAAYVLDIYGSMAEAEVVQGLIGELGLQDRVTLHGFVSDAVLDRALQRADLAINLRNPTMGEASGSQLRIWANSLPSVVSDVSWYGTLPDDAVFRVTPGREVEELQAHLAAIRREPGRFREAGLRGQVLLRRDHQPAQYAQALLDIATLTPQMHARRNALLMARRAAAALMQVAGGAPVTKLTAPAASAIHELMGLRRRA